MIPKRFVATSTLLLAMATISFSAEQPSRPADEPEPPDLDMPVEGEPAEPAAETEPAAALRSRLERALKEGWGDLSLLVECRDEDDRLERVEILGSGVGIWQDARQFRLAEEQIRSMLQALDEARFPEMEEVYGGLAAPEPPEEQGVRVICRVFLQLDGAEKQVIQRLRGEQKEELLGLARKLIESCRGPAQEGLAVESLADGLKKLAEGKLAGETLTVVLNRRPEKGEKAAPGGTFLLRIARGRATLQPYGPQGEVGAAISVEMPPEELRAIAAMLAKQGVHELPINLWSEGYTDLTVEVLSGRATVQARPFSGMDPEAQGKERQRFRRIVEGLSDLRSSRLDRSSLSPPAK